MKKLLLLAPTSVTALNIVGTTIQSGLRINPNSNTYSMGKLSETLKAKQDVTIQKLLQL